MSEFEQPQQAPATMPPPPQAPATIPPPPNHAPQAVPQHYAPTSQGYPHGLPGHVMVAPKNPAVSLLASFFIPGLGSMINGETGKGIGILVGYILSFFLTVVIIGFFGLFGFWVWGMVDAYQSAQRWNARHGIIS